jgi:L-iditol 2-dehydrogenase
MKAVVLKGPNEFISAEIPVPEIGEGELLVRVKSCAICGTDLRILEGKKTKGVRYPSVIGHEIAGIIEESRVRIGDGGLKPGARVCLAPVIPCHSCRYCLEGRENACKNRTAVGYEYDGGFAEFLRIPAKAVEFGHVQPLPENMSFEEGSLVEPLSCCLNGIRKADVGLGDVCLIVGAGPIGLMHIQLARAAGAGTVIVGEPNHRRREAALRFGADMVVDPETENIAKVLMDITNGYGVDSLIMAIGVPAIVNDLLKVIRKGGTMNLFAGFSGTGECTIEANIIHYNEITVNGTTASTRLDYLHAKDLIANNRVHVKDLVTHRYGLGDFNEAYQTAKAGTGIKIMVVP